MRITKQLAYAWANEQTKTVRKTWREIHEKTENSKDNSKRYRRKMENSDVSHHHHEKKILNRILLSVPMYSNHDELSIRKCFLDSFCHLLFPWLLLCPLVRWIRSSVCIPWIMRITQFVGQTLTYQMAFLNAAGHLKQNTHLESVHKTKRKRTKGKRVSIMST